MSDPRRYLDDDRSDLLSRDLLQSAGGDDIDDAHADELMRNIGARGPWADAANDTGQTSPPPAPASGTRLILVTTFALVVAGGALFTYGETRAPRASDATSAPAMTVTTAPLATTAVTAPVDPPPAARTPSLGSPSDPHASSDAPATPTAAAISVATLPDAVTERPARSANPAAPKTPPKTAATPASEEGDLSGEVHALEGVRTAIAQRRIADARELLGSYERTFPTKLLAQEARTLEIEALLADGHREEAETLARAFLASSGDTPYATRVRSLVSTPRATRLP